MNPAGYAVASRELVDGLSEGEASFGWVRHATGADQPHPVDLVILARKDGRFQPVFGKSRLVVVDSVQEAVDQLASCYGAFVHQHSFPSLRPMAWVAPLMTYGFYGIIGGVSAMFIYRMIAQ